MTCTISETELREVVCETPREHERTKPYVQMVDKAYASEPTLMKPNPIKQTIAG